MKGKDKREKARKGGEGRGRVREGEERGVEGGIEKEWATISWKERVNRTARGKHKVTPRIDLTRLFLFFEGENPLISVDELGLLKIWNIGKPKSKPIVSISATSGESMNCICVSSTCTQFVTASDDKVK